MSGNVSTLQGGNIAAGATQTSASMPVTWAMRFLADIGAPVTGQNIASIIAWGNAESGGRQAYGGWQNYNPLNIVHQQGIPDSGQGGTQGDIANFASLNQGADASAHLFMRNGAASPIIQALRGNASTGAVNAAVNSFYSTWGGSITFSSSVPPDVSGVPGASGSQGQDASTASDPWWEKPLKGALFGPASSVPDLANALGIKLPGSGALAGVDSFFKITTGLLANWRYVVEVIGGVAITLLGVLLIMKDLGVGSKVAQAAPVVAEVAAA